MAALNFWSAKNDMPQQIVHEEQTEVPRLAPQYAVCTIAVP